MTELAPFTVQAEIGGQDANGNYQFWQVSVWRLDPARKYRFEHANLGTDDWAAYPNATLITGKTERIYHLPLFEVPYTPWYTRCIDITDEA